MTTLSTTTPMMKPSSTQSCSTPATIAAASRMTIRMFAICSHSLRSRPAFLGGVMTLGPKCACRAAASAGDRPRAASVARVLQQGQGEGRVSSSSGVSEGLRTCTQARVAAA
jgi:hypothetical protein